MNRYIILSGRRLRFTIIMLLISVTADMSGQESFYPCFYRVYFRDKGDDVIDMYDPEDILSSRAIQRRQKYGIPVIDLSDLPVYAGYIDQITTMGFKVHCTSKWMNTALFKTQSLLDINVLLTLPFVLDVKIVKTPGKFTRFSDKLDFILEQHELPLYNRPISMVNGYPLHNSGYVGRDVLIAVLDGGFFNADVISSTKSLRNRNGIKATYDFVNNTGFVYNSSIHGTAVLSVLAGDVPGVIEGTAPGADYLLLKTEDVASEFPCEEDYWAAGAEFADSAGADIISSSLGYFNFDDPALNYKHADLDGNTAFITKIADIAAGKGILVVSSAGNERNHEWKRINFPADGDSVLAVGSVDGNNNISIFSSAGPSSDGQIKPDNTAMGESVTVQISEGSVGRSNGTSFSCPVLSGMAACLIQAVPMAANTDIINVLHSCADRYYSPDSLYGFGIPDIKLALLSLQDIFISKNNRETYVGPNPASNDIELIFLHPPENFNIEIISMTGKILFRKEYKDFAGRKVRITEIGKLSQGIYILRIKRDNTYFVHKIIKVRN